MNVIKEGLQLGVGICFYVCIVIFIIRLWEKIIQKSKLLQAIQEKIKNKWFDR